MDSCLNPGTAENIPITLSLPPLRIILTREKLEATISSSLCLDVPSHLSSIESIDQLLQTVEETHLWIARLRSCCIDVSLVVNGSPLREEHMLEAFSYLIKHCDLWSHLGLRLEYDRHDTTRLPGVMSFSVQHPSLDSALVPPANANVAQFRSLILSINIVESIEKATVPKPSQKKRKRPVQEDNTRLSREASSDNSYSHLCSKDQSAVENFMSSLGFPAQSDGVDRAVRKTTKKTRFTIDEVLDKLANSTFLEVVFGQLMVASRKKYKNIQLVNALSTPCLTKLVPGVFHIPYIEAISQRSGFLAVISSSLARLTNAESPSLRQKIQTIGLKDSLKQTIVLEADNYVSRIEKCTWDVLMAHYEMPTSRGRTGKGQQRIARRILEDETASDILIPEYNNIFFSNGQFSLRTEEEMLSQQTAHIAEFISVDSLELTCGQNITTLNQPYRPILSTQPKLPSMNSDDTFTCFPAGGNPIGGSQLSSAEDWSIYPDGFGLFNITETMRGERGTGLLEDESFDPTNFQSLDDWLVSDNVM